MKKALQPLSCKALWRSEWDSNPQARLRAYPISIACAITTFVEVGGNSRMLTESLKPLKTPHFQLPSTAKPGRSRDSSRAEIRLKKQHFGGIQERYGHIGEILEKKTLLPTNELHCLTSEIPAVDHHHRPGKPASDQADGSFAWR